MPQQAKRDIDTEAPAFLGRRPAGAAVGVHERRWPRDRISTAESFERPLEFPDDQITTRKLLPIILVAPIFSVAVIIGL